MNFEVAHYKRSISLRIKKLKVKAKEPIYSLCNFLLFKKFAQLVFGERIELRKFAYGLSYLKNENKHNIISNDKIKGISCAPNFDLVLNVVEECFSIKNENYVAQLKNVGIIGSSDLILTKDNKCIYDLKYMLVSKNVRFTDLGLRYYDEKKCVIKPSNIKYSFNTGIMMTGNYSWNYYHLLFEVIAKFEIINKLNIDQNVPIIMDIICKNVPQYKELINLFNIDNRDIIYLKRGQRYDVEKLYFVSPFNFIAPNFFQADLICDNDVFLNPESIEYIRMHLIPPSIKKKFPKRIFLSRLNASNRRAFNEDRVFDLLEKYGFVKVFTEEMNILDQVSLFNQAEFIIGGSGAAFTNIMFCNDNCKIICLMNYKLSLNIFSTIAHHLSLQMIYLTDESKQIEKGIGLHDSYNIDLDKLNRLFLKML